MKGDLLLVIDMQNVYKKGGRWECPKIDSAIQNILKIQKSGATSNTIFTEFIASKKPNGVWKNYNRVYADVNTNKIANEIIPEFFIVSQNYKIYTKSVYSSLKNHGVKKACKKAKRVVVTGVIAECCVLSTIFDLIDKGIYFLYITDAVAGLDEPKEKATELILSGLCPLHLKMMTTAEYLNERSRSKNENHCS